MVYISLPGHLRPKVPIPIPITIAAYIGLFFIFLGHNIFGSLLLILDLAIYLLWSHLKKAK
jgi:hypothetical protein